MAWLIEPPNEASAVALPLSLINQIATKVVGINVKDPCPKVLIATIPKNNPSELLRLLIQSNANPNKRATMVNIILAPNLSNRCPTANIKIAAVRDPAVYMLDTTVLDSSKSFIIGSTKIETL